MTLHTSDYPPSPVAWCTKLIDVVCQAGLGCSDWRATFGVAPSSWLSYRVGNIAESFPHLITFSEYYHQQQQQQQIINQQQEQQSGSMSSVSSLSGSSDWWQLLVSYAWKTPSTALGDLTTGTALLVLLVLVLSIRTIKWLLLPLLEEVGRRAGRRTHGPDWERHNQARIQKFAEYVVRLLYHCSISAYGIYYFWDKEWWKLPAGTMTLFRDYPYHPIEPGMAWYYLVQSAYNVEALWTLVQVSFSVKFVFHWNSTTTSSSSTTTSNGSNVRSNGSSGSGSGTNGSNTRLGSGTMRRNVWPIQVGWSPTVRGDFREMFIHHIITNLLIVGSSFFRFTRIGSMVFLVHDISDIPVDLSKLANFLKWKRATEVCFAAMVLLWMICRLYILPFVIYRSVLYESWLVSDNIDPLYYVCYRHFFYLLVGLLILLHVAWFVMFWSIGYLLFCKGEAHDLSEHKKGEVQPNGITMKQYHHHHQNNNHQNHQNNNNNNNHSAQQQRPNSQRASNVTTKKSE